MTHRFCPDHHSFFCPCVRPHLYTKGIGDTRHFKGVDTLEKSRAVWNDKYRRREEELEPTRR